MKNLFQFTLASYLILTGCGGSDNEQSAPVNPTKQIQVEPVKEKILEEKPTKEVKKTNEYSGVFFGGDIDGTLTFETDKSVRGKFYSIYGVCRLLGTNYVDDVIEAEMILGDEDPTTIFAIYHGTLRKSLTNKYIVWSGKFQHGHNLDEDGNLYPGGEYFEIRRFR